MSDETKDGASCSINSKPLGNNSDLHFPSIKSLSIKEVISLIESKVSSVIIIDAEWCTDCRNQMRNLPQFEEKLRAKNITVNIFTVEGPVYDQFISPGHKALAMKIYSSPVNAQIFNTDSTAIANDTTSVMAVRGREGYPAIFFIEDGAIQLWSIEDVSVKQLEVLAQKILKI